MEAFEKALQLDPTYAPAWAALSIPLYYHAEREPTREAVAATRQRALAAAERSVALDPDLAEGYSALSFLRGTLNWDWAQARADMDRALALNPGDATIQRRYGILLAVLGRDQEALAATRKATELDPLFPGNWVNLADRHIEAGEYDRARAALQRALEIAPEHVEAAWALAGVSLLQGRAAEALAAFERITEEQVRLVGVAVAEHSLGHAAASQRALEALEARYGARAPCMIAFVHAWRGERDRAFEWLDRAYVEHDVELAAIGGGPLRQLLKDDPRYDALLHRMNLPVR